MEIRTKDRVMRLIPITDEIIRVIAAPEKVDPDRESRMVEKKTSAAPFRVEEKEGWVTLITSKVKVTVDKTTGSLTWSHPDGSLWLYQPGMEFTPADVIRYVPSGEEGIKRVKTVDGERTFNAGLVPVKTGTAFQTRILFQFQEGEAIHGLGQAEEGIYNYRGHVQYLYQHNMRIPMPVLVSSLGWGIFLDCCSLMTFVDKDGESHFLLDLVEQADFYFLAGGSLDLIIRDLRTLTGKAPLLPRWAYGYIQSKEQYYTARELSDVVREYRKRGIPLDCVVQDWNTWENGKWGNKHVDPVRYGDLKERLEEIHGMHAHAMISVWPNMSSKSEDYREFSDAGLLLQDDSTYDAFSEEGRKLYWKQARNLFESGFDGWWCDSTEPFTGPDWGGEERRGDRERFLLVGNEHKKYLNPLEANAYALMHARGIYENQRKETQEKRVVNLTRSGYPSGQKYGAVLWSGDTCASWESFRIQITECLNMATSGYPFWTLDIGGFFTVGEKWQNRGCGCNTDPTPKWFWKGKYDEGVHDLGYCELYTRWLEMGCFLPMFRSHGTDTPREIWNFGEPGTPFYDAIARFIRLRYQLMPYIYSLAAAVHFQDYTMTRSLLFDFPEDKTARDLDSEFMFGPSLLVCPVTEPMYYEAKSTPIDREKTWDCYLPEGPGWYDYWTHAFYPGGKWIKIEAPLDRMPIFVKAGSILPTVKGTVYADQKPDEPMKIQIYPGADAKFDYYEDEGDSYRYEEGVYSLIRMTWKDETKEFALEEKHTAPGMRKLQYRLEIL